MKNSFSLFLSFLLIAVTGFSQVSGEWYGVGTVSKSGVHNSYLSELIIKQAGTKITGEFNYSFRNASIQTKVTGTFNPKTRELLLKATPVLNYKSQDVNGADCPMEGSFTLLSSRLETTLRGQFNPLVDYRFTCPAINVKFVKSAPGQKVDIGNAPKDEFDLSQFAPPEEPKAPQVSEAEKESIDNLNKRAFETSPVIEVDADSLKVTLYDNGEVDRDTISLFYNRQLVAHKKMLSDKPLTFSLALDTSINEIAMYAENLGTIPPNTALCIVYAGEQRFELSMSSNFIKNAAIRFRKKVKQGTPQ